MIFHNLGIPALVMALAGSETPEEQRSALFGTENFVVGTDGTFAGDVELGMADLA